MSEGLERGIKAALWLAIFATLLIGLSQLKSLEDNVTRALCRLNTEYYCQSIAETRDTGFGGYPMMIQHTTPARRSRVNAEVDSANVVRDTSGLDYFNTPVRSITVEVIEDCGCTK